MPTPPVGDGHWGDFASAAASAAVLPTLSSAYATESRGCCRAAIQGAIWSIVRAHRDAPEVVVLGDAWWGSTDDWRAAVAVLARARHRDALLEALRGDRPALVAAAVGELHGPGDEEEIALLRAVSLDTARHRGWVRQRALRRLAALGFADHDDQTLDPHYPPWLFDPAWLRRRAPAIVPVLIDRLERQPEWHYQASYALGHLRAVAAVPALSRAATRSPLPPVAIEALGRIASPDAAPALRELTLHADALVRDSALRALVHVDLTGAVTAALAALDDPDPAVRDRAAFILTRHPEQRAVTALIRLTDTAHAAAAARALGQLGDPRAFASLWRLFTRTADRRTRQAAVLALMRVDGPYRGVHRTEAPPLRRAYTRLLGHKAQWKPRRTLIALLVDDDPGVRRHAVAALTRLGATDDTRAAVRPLLHDIDPRVRAAARAHDATAFASDDVENGAQEPVHLEDLR